MKTPSQERRYDLPVILAGQEFLARNGLAATPRLRLPSSSDPGRENAVWLTGQVLGPPRQRLTFYGQVVAFRLRVTRASLDPALDCGVRPGDILPVQSSRAPIRRQLRKLSAGTHIECAVTLAQDGLLVDPDSGELVTAALAADCTMLRAAV